MDSRIKRENHVKMIRVLIWGTGEWAKDYMTYYHSRMNDFVQIKCFIDNNEKNWNRLFFGYEIKGFQDALILDFDYIVIFNSYVREIMGQIEKISGCIMRTLTINEFFKMYMETSRWNEKDVMFIGDKIQFELMEYRAGFAFQSIKFHEYDETENIPFEKVEKSDAVFLCPPVLLDNREMKEYEDRIIRNYKLDTGRQNIFRYCEWHYYIECDREIGKGTANENNYFLVIGVSDPMQGWGNLLLRVMGGITYAKVHNMIPIVDMKYMKNQYLPDSMIGKHNAWEDFFEQTCEYSLEEVYRSHNVVLTGINAHIDCNMEYGDISLKKNIREYIDGIYVRLFPENEKVLGVIYRGTDYYRAFNHESPVTIEDFMESVDIFKNKIGFTYIFLATEVLEAVEQFKKRFGSHLFYVDQMRYPENERRWLFTIHFNRENDEYQKGLEYLTVLTLLSKCDALYGINTGTFRAARVMNGNKYEYVEMV